MLELHITSINKTRKRLHHRSNAITERQRTVLSNSLIDFSLQTSPTVLQIMTISVPFRSYFWFYTTNKDSD